MRPPNAFGPDRDEEPGVTPIPHAKPPAWLTEFAVESCLMHSESKGWLPAVTFWMLADDGAGIVCSMVADESLTKMLADIAFTASRAHLDLSAAREKGIVT